MCTQNELKELLDYNPETGVFTWKLRLDAKAIFSGDIAGNVSKGNNGKEYWQIGINYRRYLAHRLAWLYIHGYMPEYVDHKNGDSLDNRIENLRECTMSENLGNSEQGPCRGVEAHGRYYRVRLWHKNKRVEVGKYETLEEANEASIKAHKELFGEFSVHNR